MQQAQPLINSMKQCIQVEISALRQSQAAVKLPSVSGSGSVIELLGNSGPSVESNTLQLQSQLMRTINHYNNVSIPRCRYYVNCLYL